MPRKTDSIKLNAQDKAAAAAAAQEVAQELETPVSPRNAVQAMLAYKFAAQEAKKNRVITAAARDINGKGLTPLQMVMQNAIDPNLTAEERARWASIRDEKVLPVAIQDEMLLERELELAMLRDSFKEVEHNRKIDLERVKTEEAKKRANKSVGTLESNKDAKPVAAAQENVTPPASQINADVAAAKAAQDAKDAKAAAKAKQAAAKAEKAAQEAAAASERLAILTQLEAGEIKL